MEVDRHVVAKNNSSPISSDRVTTLKGHQSEVMRYKYLIAYAKLIHLRCLLVRGALLMT